MKTVIKDGRKVVVAEDSAEALRMFKKQLQARKNAIVNDNPDKYNVWDDDKKEYSSFKNNRDYYDYGI